MVNDEINACLIVAAAPARSTLHFLLAAPFIYFLTRWCPRIYFFLLPLFFFFFSVAVPLPLCLCRRSTTLCLSFLVFFFSQLLGICRCEVYPLQATTKRGHGSFSC